MRKVLLVILFLSLIACSPQVTVTSEVTVTLTPLLTATLTPTLTEVSLESLPIEELVQKYFAGEIDDISFLSNEHRTIFSRALVQTMKEKRGTNVVFYTYLGEKYFVNPNTLQPEKVPSDPSQEFLQANTMGMYLPVGLNAEGKLQVEVNGEVVVIENSAGTDWNMIITEPDDSRIDWPTVAKLGFGDFPDLTLLQFYLAKKDSPGKVANIVPIVILDKNIGEIALEAGPAFRKDTFLKIGTVETDSSGTPIFVKVSLMFDGGTAVLQEEGSSSEVLAAPRITEGFSFLETLEENTVYYLGFPVNQSIALNEVMFSSTNNLDGFAPMDQNLNTLTGDGLQENQVSLIFAHTLIKKSK